MPESTIRINDPNMALHIFGARDQHLKQLRDTFDVGITYNGGSIHLQGDRQSISNASLAIKRLRDIVEKHGHLTPTLFHSVFNEHSQLEPNMPKAFSKMIYPPKTEGQRKYVSKLVDPHVKILAVTGPPGTGKTLMAMQYAAQAVLDGMYSKLFLTTSVTPIAGEEIGYIPGDVSAKMQSWMLPMTDHLKKFTSTNFFEGGIDMEFIPLAQIRGRTIDNAILMADECQNCSLEIFEALLTRPNFHSKLIMAGDFRQNDRRQYVTDFEYTCEGLDGMNGFEWVELTDEDIIRSKLIAEINRRMEIVKTNRYRDREGLDRESYDEV